ncbi:hypothetical protein PITC_041840 [Penicillium italicum]|uniref:Uncharacterized protein n=1 Tax=Penicillium italicum TaxID=40296 RepID=A0A0A2KKT7_PENIT|nr:hypothetical protein PITC_041840 [Penicillium italicum]
MSSAFSAINTASIPLNNFIRTWSTQSSPNPPSLVTVTSIQTETVYPTWVYTISSSGSDSSTATTVLDFSSSTQNPTAVTVTLTTTKLSTTKQDTIISTPSPTATVISESSTSTLTPTTSVLSSSTGDFPNSATSESSDHPSSMWILPVPLTSSSTSISSSLPVLLGTATSSVSPMSSKSTPASSSTAPTNTPTTLPSTETFTGASSSETSQVNNSSSASSKTGTIVGSIIGGSAITIFALLACALYMRRRRQKMATERLGIRQELLRGNSTSSSTSHYNHHRYPSIPANIGPRSPVLPVIPLQQQPSNPDLSLDTMYLRGETTPQNPFADPPSAVIEISAPSRSVSIYSTSSRGAGIGGQAHWDCGREGVGAGSLAVPHAYLDTPVMRDSMRSDPFDLDLEPPPNAHHRSSVPPIPSTWGVKF